MNPRSINEEARSAECQEWMTDSFRYVNRSELAEELGVNLSTVDNYRRRGMPEHERDGKTMFHVLECVLWKTAFDMCNESRDFNGVVKGDLGQIIRKIEAPQLYLLARLWLKIDGPQRERLSKASAKLSAAIADLADIAAGRLTEEEEAAAVEEITGAIE